MTEGERAVDVFVAEAHQWLDDHAERVAGDDENEFLWQKGEFSVAVNLEVKTRSGWFSDRTAAYLASGKPAVVQDTGFSDDLPCGEGLFAFRTIDEAASAIEEIQRNYRHHCAAARRIAEEHLDAKRLLARILDRA